MSEDNDDSCKSTALDVLFAFLLPTLSSHSFGKEIVSRLISFDHCGLGMQLCASNRTTMIYVVYFESLYSKYMGVICLFVARCIHSAL